MDFQNDQPIYLQIGTAVKEQIVNGTLRPGDRLPSVREYAVIYEVSPLTIHRMIQHLEAEGIIETKKGIGSFVRPDVREKLAKAMINGQVRHFVSHLRNCGLTAEEIKTAVWRELELELQSESRGGKTDGRDRK